MELVSSVERHVLHFEEEGFSPFMRAFDEVHRYHLQTCQLIQPKGDVVGKVVGIGETGELLIETDIGVEAFHAGEVSLRGGPQET